MSHFDAAWYLQRAREALVRDGELEIDSDAKVSMGADNGAYVQCWVWVDDDPVPCEEEDE